jgi:putative ABC transport system permease protein
MMLIGILGMQLRLVIRTLWRNPRFAITSFVVLSVGIGTISAIFSVANKVLLEPLPYPDPDRLVQLGSRSLELGDESLTSIPKYLIWRNGTTAFETMAASDVAVPEVSLTQDGVRRPLKTGRVSANFFHLFGAHMAVGRTFSAREDGPEGPNAVVISDELWRRYFHADASITERVIILNDVPFKVVGVLAPGTHLEPSSDVWLPLRADPRSTDLIGRVCVIARIREGLSLQEARSNLFSVQSHKDWLLQVENNGESFATGVPALIPLREAMIGNVRPSLYLLMGAAGFGLAISCLNFATLILARASQRRRETAVRMAIGAARKHIVFELLTESVLLSLCGGMGGIVLGYFGVRALLAISPEELPRVGANGIAIGLDWKVLVFTLSVSVFVGILCALMPAIKASHTSIDMLVKSGSSQSGMTLRRNASRSSLVIAEISFSFVLLFGVGLLLRTFAAQRALNQGFDEKNVVTMGMSLDNARFDSTTHVAQLIHSAEQRMKFVPGVEGIATTSALPLAAGLPMPFKSFEHHFFRKRYDGTASWRSVSPQYFKVFQIKLLRGRMFTNEDDENAARVVLINDAMAKKYWIETDANPVGEYLAVGEGMIPGSEDPPREIIGIVADVREAGLDREPEMYVPAAQVSDGMNTRNNRLLPLIWTIRVDGTRPSPVARFQQELANLSGGQPLAQPVTMHEAIAASSARIQFYVTVLGIFSGVAVFLTAMGIYGLVAYSVEQRGRELAIRAALGAEPFDVQAMVVMQALRLTLWGALAGIPLAMALVRVTVSMIYGVQTWDPFVFALIGVLLCVVSLLSAYGPSVRASHVDPAGALRSES